MLRLETLSGSDGVDCLLKVWPFAAVDVVRSGFLKVLQASTQRRHDQDLVAMVASLPGLASTACREGKDEDVSDLLRICAEHAAAHTNPWAADQGTELLNAIRHWIYALYPYMVTRACSIPIYGHMTLMQTRALSCWMPLGAG